MIVYSGENTFNNLIDWKLGGVKYNFTRKGVIYNLLPVPDAIERLKEFSRNFEDKRYAGDVIVFNGVVYSIFEVNITQMLNILKNFVWLHFVEEIAEFQFKGI